ncbi:WD40 repeat domain-containing protein [Streptomyces sp. NPDC000941]
MAFDHRGAVVESVAWSPDGSRIATGDHDGTVRVWSAQAGAELSALTGHQDWISRIAWSSSGRLLASAGGAAVRVAVRRAPGGREQGSAAACG